MPIKLIPPRPGAQNYFGRGTYLGVFVDRSTKTDRKAVARKVIKLWESEIERGVFNPKPTATFLSAAVAYMNAGGDSRPVEKLLVHFGEKPLNEIGQIEIDSAAAALFPNASAATRNRECYTPVLAIMRRAKVAVQIERPIGWRGNRSTAWLEPHQAFAVFEAADKRDLEFGLFLRTLCYTGMRLGEALAVKLGNVNLTEQKIFLPITKNGESRSVYLPQHLVVAFANQPPRVNIDRSQGGGPPRQDVGVAFMERKAERRLFRFVNSGFLRDMLKDVFKTAGLAFPARQGGFHIFCHTYGTWMHNYGKLDAYGLVRTGRWMSAEMADSYTHTGTSSEAKQAELLPIPQSKVS